MPDKRMTLERMYEFAERALDKRRFRTIIYMDHSLSREDFIQEIVLAMWDAQKRFDEKKVTIGDNFWCGVIERCIWHIMRDANYDKRKANIGAFSLQTDEYGRNERRTRIDKLRDERVSPEEIAEEHDRMRYIQANIDRLNERRQRIIRGLYFEGMSCRELSYRLKISHKAVRENRDAALKQLKKWMEEDDRDARL